MALAAALNILRFFKDFPKLFFDKVSSCCIEERVVERGVRSSDSDCSNDRSELATVSLMMEKEETETDSLSIEPPWWKEESISIASSGNDERVRSALL